MDPSGNRERLGSLVAEHPGCGLYVLPELFTTGFVTDPLDQAPLLREEYEATLRWMQGVSEAQGAAVVGSVCHCPDVKGRNRLVVTRPGERPVLADKRHLFRFGGESVAYAAGRERAVVDLAGLRALPLVCYDLRFPVYSRCRAREYDTLIYVAAWPSTRIAAWDVLLRARAIENQCLVVGVNRVGRQGRVEYPGHSMVVGPRGDVLAEAQTTEAEVLVVDVEAAPVEHYRERFPVLDDADSFQLSL